MIPLLLNHSSSVLPRKSPPTFWAALFILLALISLPIQPAVAASGSPDNTPPTLLDWNFSPTSVDVLNGPATVNLDLHVTDDLSGVIYAYVEFISPTGQGVFTDSIFPPALDFHAPLTLTLPQGSEPGPWIMTGVGIQDSEGNFNWYDPARLATEFMGFPTTLQVTSTGGGGGGDTTAPNLTKFNFYPKSVNVASSDATVTVDMHVTDDSSGFTSATVTFANPNPMGSPLSVTASLNSGAILDCGAPGIYLDCRVQATLTIPQSSQAGNWTVSSVVLQDSANNARTIDTTALSSQGYPTILTVSNTPQLSDTTPPTLETFDFTPKSVDVTNGDGTINFTLNVTDDLSGFNYGYVYLYSPSYGQSRYGYFYLASGNPRNGTAQGSATIFQNSEPGDWTVGSVYLYDATGNYQYIDKATLDTLGFPSTFTVTSQNADVTPPQLTSFVVDTQSINVSSGPQSVKFTLGASDDKSGLDFSCQRTCYYMIQLRSPSGKQIQNEADLNVKPVSGTAQNGVWEVNVTLPKYAEAGTWTVSNLTLHDMTGNVQWFDKTALQSKGYPVTVAVASSPSDTQAPQLKSLAFNPAFADTSAAGKYISLSIGATDNLAGLDLAYHSQSPNAGTWFGLSFQSPSGNQRLWISPQTQLAGTSVNGTWQGTSYLPQYSEAGNWVLNQAQLKDAAGNVASYDATQLNNLLGYQPTLQVILPSLVADGTISDPTAGGSVQDSVFSNRAEVTIPPNLVSPGTTVSIDVLSSDLHLPVPAGFTTNGTNFVNIKLDPLPAMPFPAPGLTLVLPLLNQMDPGTPLILYKVDPNSGNLVPEPGIGGGAATGKVNADGLSATFTGVASLSTVVGLIPSGAVLGDLDGDGKVDCADIAIVRAAFGKKLGQAGFDSRADTNHDNVVNVRDLSFVSRNLPSSIVCRITPTGAVQVPGTAPATTLH